MYSTSGDEESLVPCKKTEADFESLDARHYRYEIFCERYLAHGNGSRAAREAGFPGKYSGTIASRLLKREDVKMTLEAMRAEAIKRNDIDIDYVVANLRAEAEDFSPGSSQANRIKATELLGKWLGMFKDNTASITLPTDRPCKVFIGIDEERI